MTSPQLLSALSDSALKSLAGTAVFGRGQTYARGGAIQDPELSPPKAGEQVALSAVVQGTQPYQTRVWVDDSHRLHGECDCPHADDGYFCKHQVAMALTLRGLLGGDVSASDPEAAKKVAAAAKRAQTLAQNREDLRAFVREQSAEVLAERLWQWASEDRNRMAELKAWAAQTRAGSDPKAVTQAITELLRPHRQYLEWRDLRSYLQRADKVLDLLRPWLEQDPAQLQALCEHALRCLYKVAERADDGDGDLSGVAEEIYALLLQALRASPPPASWADRWLSLVQADPWGLFDETEALEAAGPAVQARYTERAAQAWQDWLAAHPPEPEKSSKASKKSASKLAQSSRYTTPDSERWSIRRRYLNCLEMQGDVQAAIDVMLCHQAYASEHVELVHFCETHGRYREAMQYAQAAHKRYPQDRNVERALLGCYERDGWDEEALVLRRRHFEADPSAANYRALLDAAQRAGQDPARYRDSLFAWAREQETSPSPSYFAFRQPTDGHQKLRNISVRVDWLLAEEQLDEVLALVLDPAHQCRPEQLLAIARGLPAAHDAEAVTLLQRVFEHKMLTAKSPYGETLALVAHICGRMPPQARSAWLAQLRTQYKAKRYFIAGLPA